MTGPRYAAYIRPRLCAVLGCWFGASIAGCGGQQASGSDPTGAVQYGDFSVQLAQAFCGGISGCCVAGGFATDTASCVTTFITLFDAQLATRQASANVAYSSVMAGTCVAAYRKAALDCYNPDAAMDASEVCSNVFVGTIALGGACATSEECLADAAQNVRCVTGVCSVASTLVPVADGPRGKLGGICGATCESYASGRATCISRPRRDAATPPVSCWVDDGLACSSGLCVAIPTLGQPCSDVSRCATDSYCDGTNCVPQIATGSCSIYDACQSSSYCDTTTYQCTPLKPDGATCISSTECSGGDCLEERCRVWSLANSAICSGTLGS